MSEEGKSVGAIAARWWSQAVGADTGAARRVRAELRRADGPVAALAISEVHELAHALRDAGHRPDPERLALIVVALSHLKEGQGSRAAEVFGRGDPPALSPIRFNALIRAHEIRDLWRPLLRALKVIRGQANAAALAQDVFHWNDRTRTRWCFEYYGEPLAAPDQTVIPKESAT